MKAIKILLFILLTIVSVDKAHTQSWIQQPSLSFDSKKNIVYTDGSTTKKVFPVMLYSFPNYLECTTPLAASSGFWNEAYNWGFNIVYSWDPFKQDLFLANCNNYKKISMLGYDSYGFNNGNTPLYSGINSFPDEPITTIGAGYTSTDFDGYKNNWNGALGFVNFSIQPYFSRIYDGATDGFASNLPYYRSPTDFDTTSYNTYAAKADILAFDYYPFKSDGTIRKNVVEQFPQLGETSIGEFTKLLKNKYPQKSIWPIVQTSWYDDPPNSVYQSSNICIYDKIIRHLTFEAIINGADGISFWGHGEYDRTASQSNDPAFAAFLNANKNSVWQQTLYETKELKELQENYDQILLEDNIQTSYVKNGSVQYCFKKASNSNKYYVFITSSDVNSVTTRIKIPNGFKIKKGSTLTSVGIYAMPAITGISPAQTKDYTNANALGHISSNRESFYTTLDKYGTNIISMELVPGNDDIAILYDNSLGAFKIHQTVSDGQGNSEFQPNWADYTTSPILSSASVFKTVRGDFNNDGYDDIALLYNYADGTFKVHLVTSNSQGNSSLQSWADYTTNNVDGNPALTSGSVVKAVAGDFNNDGNDDIALIYNDQGNFKVHLITSDGIGHSVFVADWANHGTNLNLSSVFQAVAGDFNNDGHDDIAIFYLYGNYNSCDNVYGSFKIHLITSDGHGNSSFVLGWNDHTIPCSNGNWMNASSVFQAISGDFNNDGNDDIAVFYLYGNYNSCENVYGSFQVHLITSDGNGNSGTSYNWNDHSIACSNGNWMNASSVIQAVSGDFNNDGNDDIAMVYKYGNYDNCTTETGSYQIHLITSDGNGNSSNILGWDDHSTPCNNWLKSAPIFQAVSGNFSLSSSGHKIAKKEEIVLLNHKVLEGKNFPNPFSVSTDISFELKKPSLVEVKVYNSFGQEITTLINEYRPVGVNITRFNSQNLPSGIYYYKIKTSDFIKTGSMILQR